MKKIIIVLFCIGFGVTVFAQSNVSRPEYTCPTGISPSEKTNSSSSSQVSSSNRNNSSSPNKKTEVSTCTTTTAKVAGNGVTRTTCTNNNSDGSHTKTTTTCVSTGAKVSFGVGEVGNTKQTCVKETETTPAKR